MNDCYLKFTHFQKHASITSLGLLFGSTACEECAQTRLRSQHNNDCCGNWLFNDTWTNELGIHLHDCVDGIIHLCLCDTKIGSQKLKYTHGIHGHIIIISDMYLVDAFIQSDLHCIQGTRLHFISSLFPGIQTHDLGAARATLYCWSYRKRRSLPVFCVITY